MYFAKKKKYPFFVSSKKQTNHVLNSFSQN